MVIDCRTWGNLPDHGESERRRAFLDGKEIAGVWYVDTDAGVVKTYCVFQDAPPDVLERARRASGVNPPLDDERMRKAKFAVMYFDLSVIPSDWEIEAPLDDVLSRTLRGKVELKPL